MVNTVDNPPVFHEDWLDKIVAVQWPSSGFLTIVSDTFEQNYPAITGFSSGVTVQVGKKTYPLNSDAFAVGDTSVITAAMLKKPFFTANTQFLFDDTAGGQPGTPIFPLHGSTQCNFINLKFASSNNNGEKFVKVTMPRFQVGIIAKLMYVAYPSKTSGADGGEATPSKSLFFHTQLGVQVFSTQEARSYFGSLTNFIDANSFDTEAEANAYAASFPGVGPWDIFLSYIRVIPNSASAVFAIGSYRKNMFENGIFSFPVPPENEDTWPTLPVGYEPYPANAGFDLNLGFGSPSVIGPWGPTTFTLTLRKKTLVIKYSQP